MIKKILLGALISFVTLFALPNSELKLSMLAKAAEKRPLYLSSHDSGCH